MRVKVISELPSTKGIIQVGRIIEIPDHLLSKLVGKVEAIDFTGVQQIATADDYHSTQPPSQPLTVQDRCQGKKVDGRICGAPFKEGINGFSSCSDMGCQVPAIPHGLIPRNQKNRI